MDDILGHDDVMASFRAALDGPRLHHGWIFAGPKGVGKALIARRIALFQLARAAGPAVDGEGLDVPASHPMAALMNAQSHPDFHVVQRLPRKSDKKTADKGKGDADAGDTRLARNISVDQIRSLRDQLHRMPTMSPYRVVIIDAAEDMETESANALLKILEEPPANCMFFLISHAPGRLLPTIRSRCRLVRFRALSVSLAEQVLALTLPDLDREERRLLAEAAQGSPGEAMRYAELDVPLMEQALTTIEAGGPNMLAERSALAKSLSGKNAQPRFELFLDYFPSRLARSVRTLTGDALAEGISLWERASDLANSARRISLDPESTVFELTASLAALTRFRNR